MPNYDFRCTKCNTVQETFFTSGEFQRTKLLKCSSCHRRTKHANQPGFRSDFNPNNPGLYNRFYPSFGCVVRDAAHLKALCKKYDVSMAGDSVGGAPAYVAEIDRFEAAKRRPLPDTSGVLWGDADTERDLRRLSPPELQRRLLSGVHQRS